VSCPQRYVPLSARQIPSPKLRAPLPETIRLWGMIVAAGQLADERLALLVALWVGVTGSYFEHGEHVELLSTSQCDPAQAVRVVVAYVNQNANRMHESFEVLAVEAIRDAWPCK
jgi:hypothetical protein